MVRMYLLAHLYDITYRSGTIESNQRLPDAQDNIVHAKSVSEEDLYLYPVNGRWQGKPLKGHAQANNETQKDSS